MQNSCTHSIKKGHKRGAHLHPWRSFENSLAILLFQPSFVPEIINDDSTDVNTFTVIDIYIYPLTGTVMERAYLVVHYRHILTINAVPDDAHMRVINTPNTHADYPPFILLVVRSLRTPVSPNTYLM